MRHRTNFAMLPFLLRLESDLNRLLLSSRRRVAGEVRRRRRASAAQPGLVPRKRERVLTSPGDNDTGEDCDGQDSDGRGAIRVGRMRVFLDGQDVTRFLGWGSPDDCDEPSAVEPANGSESRP